MGAQCLVHRLGLKAFEHHEQRRVGLKQPIRRIRRGGGPDQRNAPNGHFQRQHGRVEPDAQRLGQRFAPGLALGGAHGGGDAA